MDWMVLLQVVTQGSRLPDVFVIVISTMYHTQVPCWGRRREGGVRGDL